jgi:hypothetical protein
MKKIQVRNLRSDGDHEYEEAVAVISVLRRKNSYFLHIRENGELTEDWWRQLPALLKTTIEQGIVERRKAGFKPSST